MELRVLVDEDGRARNVVVLGSIEALNDAAIEAARHWGYAPGTKDDVPVRVWLPVSVRFVLE